MCKLITNHFFIAFHPAKKFFHMVANHLWEKLWRRSLFMHSFPQQNLIIFPLFRLFPFWCLPLSILSLKLSSISKSIWSCWCWSSSDGEKAVRQCCQLVYSQRMEACSATKLKLTQSTWAILPIFPDTNNYSWHLQGNQETRYKCLSPRKEIGKWISFYQILKQLLRSNWQEWF